MFANKVVTKEEALSKIHDGQTIMFGDWHGEFAADDSSPQILYNLFRPHEKRFLWLNFLLYYAIKVEKCQEGKRNFFEKKRDFSAGR